MVHLRNELNSTRKAIAHGAGANTFASLPISLLQAGEVEQAITTVTEGLEREPDVLHKKARRRK